MKGVVFNILESFISEGWGDQTYEDILAMCPLSTKEPFVGPGTYPDSDLMTIAAKAAEKLGLPLDAALRAFGKYAFPKLAEQGTQFVDSQPTARDFLLSVDSVIHVEVRKLMPKAITPAFRYEDTGPDSLVIHYSSARKLCKFMEGLLDGVAEHYGTVIEHSQSQCMHEGAPHCTFVLKFHESQVEGAA